MTQQFSSEGLAFSSDAMRHSQHKRLEGADEQWIEHNIHAQIQGKSVRRVAPNVKRTRGQKD